MIQRALLATDACFPYGTYPVEDEVQDNYNNEVLSYDYPLPPELPLHHPALQSLEGTYPLLDAPGPWWSDFVDRTDPCLRSLLGNISTREYRQGCLEEQRWRAFRQSGQEKAKSPRLRQFLEGTTWEKFYVDRGSSSTPEQMDLIISTRPEHFMNMSNGDEWESCQQLRYGSDNHHLPGNFYDTGVAVVMLLPHGADIWEEDIVLARTTIRLMRHVKDTSHLVICRTYHNNRTLAQHLITFLVRLFDERGLSWGIMNYIRLIEIFTEGELGETLRQRQHVKTVLSGEPFWLPEDWHTPYVDGNHEWSIDRRGWPFLRAEVLLYR